MKYESNILKRLIDTYGVVGNPRYISEIIKEFIVRGKERFPELFTYQSDWLAHIDEFGLNPSYTVSYTGQSIYAPNTLESPVKSAILSGQTLVNLSPFTDKITIENQAISETKKVLQPLNQNTKYILIFNINNSTSSLASNYIMVRGYNTDGAFKEYGRTIKNFGNGRHYILLESTEGNVERIFIGSDFSCEIDDTILAIYQEGMENWDIPYFEGMQSVKMPVLTTSNEDGTKTNILTVNEEVELRGIGEGSNRVEDELDCLTGEVTQRIGEIVLDGSENWLTAGSGEGWYKHYITNNLFGIDLAISDRYSYLWGLNHTNNNSIIGKLSLHKDIKGYLYVGSDLSVNDFKQHLSQNPLTVKYKLETESIKTVDLTILDQNDQNINQLMSFNGGTHFNTGSLEGTPLPSVSVSVETDLVETLKVCSLEGNTL